MAGYRSLVGLPVIDNDQIRMVSDLDDKVPRFTKTETDGIRAEEQELAKRYSSQKQEYVNGGVVPETTGRMAFDKIVYPKTKLFINPIWFDIVAWMTAETDPFLARSEDDLLFLREFLPAKDLANPPKSLARSFLEASLKYDSDPNGFLDALQLLASDVRFQNWCEELLLDLSAGDAGPDRLRCWYALQTHITHEVGATLGGRIQKAAGSECIADISSVMTQLEAIEKDGYTNDAFAARHRFLDRCMLPSATVNDRSSEMLAILYEILTSAWEEDYYVFAVSEGLRKLLSDYHPDFATMHHFRMRLSRFYCLMTGEDMAKAQVTSTTGLLANLQNTALARQQQFAPVYKIINDLRADVARKQHVITCLGFRHILENLPDQTRIKQNFLNANPQGATGYWKLTWRFVVERELVLLMFERLNAMTTPPASFTPKPRADLLPASETLRELLEYDFKYWQKQKRSGKRTNHQRMEQSAADIAVAYNRYVRFQADMAATPKVASTVLHPTAPPPPTLGAAALTGPLSTQSINTPLFDALGLRYEGWNSYERGKGLFGELSASIHHYNKQFEFEETSWARSDFKILQWLSPPTACAATAPSATAAALGVTPTIPGGMATTIGATSAALTSTAAASSATPPESLDLDWDAMRIARNLPLTV